MNVKSTALTHLETLKDNLKNKNVSKTANIFDLDANPQVLDEVIALVKNDEIDEVIFHGDAFDRGSQNIRVFDRFKLLKALLGSKFIYILGNHELLMLDSIFLRDEISFENWIRNGGHTVIEEVNHTNTLTVWDLAEWVFLNAQLFYIDDKDWLHVHAGIPKDLTLKTMSIEQAAFEKIQQELKDTDNLNTSEYERIFEKMTALFWIRRWSVRFIEISQRSYVSNNLKDSQKIFHETQTLHDWLHSFQIQGVMFGHDHHKALFNIGDLLLGSDIANQAYIISNHEGLFLHQIDKPSHLIIPYQELITRIERQINAV